MEQKLSIALQTLYSTRRDDPHAIRMMIRLRDPIDRSVLRKAVDMTMQRYPYFCVRLRKRAGSMYLRRTLSLSLSAIPLRVWS